MKILGKRSAGKPHAAFDVAGAGNGEMVSTAPVLDPTLGEWWPVTVVTYPTDATPEYFAMPKSTLIIDPIDAPEIHWVFLPIVITHSCSTVISDSRLIVITYYRLIVITFP